MRLPALAPRSWGDLIQNFEALQSWLAKAGDQASGVVTVTFPGGGPNSGTQTVSHGLGRVPTRILLGSSIRSDGGTAHGLYTPVDAATFNLQAIATNGNPAAGVTCDVSWEAIA